jgi:hypothetical protein
MSMNPYHLELMAKARQEELLALARPKQIAIPSAGQSSLGARMRIGLARLMIRIGWRLAPLGSDRVCPHCHEGGPRAAAGAHRRCSCPGQSELPQCPPLPSG